ncbi:Aste57867_15977 [Aphanomyces stellatus]|uniref:Aste57867_15977 protein n=1 Tax=Aphanomyces stellatus TaxID=120398 RepID=A0A485L4P8_9STRA|nr:hypothetical protein As57867_015921 [Aphanomyces stellatus]VFT92762.1 Aste57867_15977 [Aphanomyces stellatus]
MEELEEAIKVVPPFARSTFRNLSAATGIPVTTLWTLLKKKKLARRTSRLKPFLTPDHMQQRFDFARSFTRRGEDGTFKWHDMMDRVHVDEKWFYITMVNRKYYLWNDEELPQRKVQSKRHVLKVMFLTEVARPRHDYHRHKMWDGKIGTWAFVETQLAQRTSKNRPRGAPVTTPITVTKEVYRRYLINFVIPAIRSQCPGSRETKYLSSKSMQDPTSAAMIINQPAQSPDFNVLDLGVFNAIQALQHHNVTRSIDDLIAAVHAAFQDLEWRVLEKTFMTLQKVVAESLKLNGDNVYKLPHLRKDKVLKLEGIPLRPHCDEDASRALEALHRRLEYERQVESLVDLFHTNCTLTDFNVDEVCQLVDGLHTQNDNEKLYF